MNGNLDLCCEVASDRIIGVINVKNNEIEVTNFAVVISDMFFFGNLELWHPRCVFSHRV
jgi:hypothetical protein